MTAVQQQDFFPQYSVGEKFSVIVSVGSNGCPRIVASDRDLIRSGFTELFEPLQRNKSVIPDGRRIRLIRGQGRRKFDHNKNGTSYFECHDRKKFYPVSQFQAECVVTQYGLEIDTGSFLKRRIGPRKLEYVGRLKETVQDERRIDLMLILLKLGVEESKVKAAVKQFFEVSK